MLNALEITGRARSHVVQVAQPRFAAHPDVVQAFLRLRDDASKAGIDLIPFSAYRDDQTQLRIWNDKFSGKKPLYDMNGIPCNYQDLSPNEIVECILNGSALPGGSRHHWGTEIDVVDAAAMPADYRPQLLPQEVAEGGLFQRLHAWLDDNIGRYGFFRPYKYFKGGMYPEPWHLSYAPISMRVIQTLDLALLMDVTQQADILGKDMVLDRLPWIYENHILNFVWPDKQ